MIEWPNSLTRPHGVANYRNLPFGGRATRDSRVRVPRKEYARSRHQRLFKENVGKTEKDVIYELLVKGSGVVFMHGEGISNPYVCHKGWQPLIKCANMTSIQVIFPFLCFLAFLWVFLYFYLFVVDKGVSLTPTYSSIAMRQSDLRSSFRTKRWLSCFYLLFCKIDFN